MVALELPAPKASPSCAELSNAVNSKQDAITIERENAIDAIPPINTGAKVPGSGCALAGLEPDINASIKFFPNIDPNIVMAWSLLQSGFDAI